MMISFPSWFVALQGELVRRSHEVLQDEEEARFDGMFEIQHYRYYLDANIGSGAY